MAVTHKILKGAIKIPVPDVTQQTDYSCGPSCLEAIAKFYGVGKEDEWQFVRGLRMDPRVGSHPDQIRRLATSYRLKVREYSRMSLAQLRQELRWRHPVMLMIQAYGLEPQGKRRHMVWRRDTGPHKRHLPFYGVAIWNSGKHVSSYETMAERIV